MSYLLSNKFMQGASSPCILLVTILAMSIGCAITSEAMVMKMDTAELTARADLVVDGTVEEIRTIGHIHTAIVKIQHVLKGNATPETRIRVSFSPSIEDSPTFRVHERVQLFLREIGPGEFQTVGGFQGKLSLD